MSLTQTSWPVIGTFPNLINVFPSFKTLPVNFKRVDNTIASLSSGVGGLIQMEFTTPFDASLLVGNFIVWKSDGYSLRSSLVEQIINTTTLLINEIFTNSDNENSFVNYRKNYYLEARFVKKETPTDQQTDVILVLDEFSKVPNDLNGTIVLDMSIIGDLINPNFDLSTRLIEGFFKEFKMQYRESYQDQRNLPWNSPDQDDFIMVAISSDKVPFNNLTDNEFDGLFFAESYPYFITYLRSDINDIGSFFQLKFILNQYSIDKSLISSFLLKTFVNTFENVSGLIGVVIPPEVILEETVFIKLDIKTINTDFQYDPSQYDSSQYS